MLMTQIAQARLLTVDDRLRLRQTHARLILDKLHQHLLEIETEVLPKSPEGRAALRPQKLDGTEPLLGRWRSGNRQGASERANRDIALGIMQGRTMPHRMAPSHRLGASLF